MEFFKEGYFTSFSPHLIFFLQKKIRFIVIENKMCVIFVDSYVNDLKTDQISIWLDQFFLAKHVFCNDSATLCFKCEVTFQSCFFFEVHVLLFVLGKIPNVLKNSYPSYYAKLVFVFVYWKTSWNNPGHCTTEEFLQCVGPDFKLGASRKLLWGNFSKYFHYDSMICLFL